MIVVLEIFATVHDYPLRDVTGDNFCKWTRSDVVSLAELTIYQINCTDDCSLNWCVLKRSYLIFVIYTNPLMT